MVGLYGRVLVPLDGSELAEQVLPHLQRLVSPAATTVALVNVIESMRFTTATPRHAPPNLYASLRASAEKYLAEQQGRLQAAGFGVETYVVEGDPATGILHVATTANVDLIAMTTHGRSGFVLWALGSVAERVIRETQLPVYLVREGTALPGDRLHRILVPLDGSARAEQALPQAVALAKATGAELMLLQVIQLLDDRNEELLFKDATESQAAFSEWQLNAESYLQQLAQSIQAEGVTCLCNAKRGDVVPTIIETAESEGVDLLVMGTHGRSGLSRWVFGSVTNKVLRGVSCPLLVIHNPPADSS
jgi:nucleotide-binding universal stress UspA family protein